MTLTICAVGSNKSALCMHQAKAGVKQKPAYSQSKREARAVIENNTVDEQRNSAEIATYNILPPLTRFMAVQRRRTISILSFFFSDSIASRSPGRFTGTMAG